MIQENTKHFKVFVTEMYHTIKNPSHHWHVSALGFLEYLRLAESQLYPVQRLTDDATFLLLHAVAVRRGPTLLRRLQTLQQAAVLSSQRLQS